MGGGVRVLNVSRTGTLEAEKPTLFIEPTAVVSDLIIRGGFVTPGPLARSGDGRLRGCGDGGQMVLY